MKGCTLSRTFAKILTPKKILGQNHGFTAFIDDLFSRFHNVCQDTAFEMLVILPHFKNRLVVHKSGNFQPLDPNNHDF